MNRPVLPTPITAAQRARVIVTRPAHDAAVWVEQLTQHGLEAVALPLIDIAACSHPGAAAALAHAHQQCAQQRYHALMFVSGNAVQHFYASKQAEAPTQHVQAAHKTRAWSPGPGTAQALLAAGIDATLIDGPTGQATQFDSESLWQQVQSQIQGGERILIVRGGPEGAAPGPLDGLAEGTAHSAGVGREWLAQRLLAAGAQVEFVMAYERRAPVWSPEQEALAQLAASDGSLWLLSSSEAVVNLKQKLPSQDWHAAQALTTHPRIAQAARDCGFGKVYECRPALKDVVASIESAHEL